MTTTIRPLEQSDFFAWHELYSAYAEFYETPLTDDRAMRVWAWLHNGEHVARGIVALDDDDQLIGLAHVWEFERLLENDKGLYLEDLYVRPENRKQGVATDLINSLKEGAAENKVGVIRWITASDNETARKVYDKLAEKTDWVTYDIALG
jgi:RimJ/RimL family protein N-acetyltransferase